jgi:glutathione S-transferase
MALTLYADTQWASPYVYSVFVALRERSIPFSVRELALDRGEQRADALWDASITAKVPMIEHDGFWLSESAAIVEYLDETFEGSKVIPADPRERARARQIMQWVRTDMVALRSARPSQSLFFPDAFPRPMPALTHDAGLAAEKLVRGASILLARAFSTEQLFASWSVADADLALMLMRLSANGDDVPAALASFARAQWQRPSVAAFVTHPRTAKPYFV